MILFGFTVIATDISWMRGNTFYELDEPILHGRARMHGYLHYPVRDDKKEKSDTETAEGRSSYNSEEKKE